MEIKNEHKAVQVKKKMNQLQDPSINFSNNSYWKFYVWFFALLIQVNIRLFGKMLPFYMISQYKYMAQKPNGLMSAMFTIFHTVCSLTWEGTLIKRTDLD